MLAISSLLPGNAAAVLGRMGSSPTTIRAGAWFVAALVVGWVVASWFWQIAAPDTAPRLEEAPLLDHQAAAKAVTSRHLFGRTSSGGDEAGGERGGINLRLLGAMTASPEAAGFAILAEDGKPSLAAVEGETFMPGVTLLQVLPGRVRVKIGERVETIEMINTENSARPAPGVAVEAAQAVPGQPGVSLRPGPRALPEAVRP
ncbi:MAG: hypothetical protein HZC22_12840 [Rhodocyclales bacterium]|nr:hypothetical protein [Rhodocyclales bacterium]